MSQSSNYPVFILDHNIQNKIIFWKILGNFLETLGGVFFTGNFLKTTCLGMYHLIRFSHCLKSSKTTYLPEHYSPFKKRFINWKMRVQPKLYRGFLSIGCLLFWDVNVSEMKIPKIFRDVNDFFFQGCKRLFFSGM